jgi:hypothetical protein
MCSPSQIKRSRVFPQQTPSLAKLAPAMVDDFAAWLAQNPESGLADLMRQYRGYGALPREAWAEFDRAVTAWQRQRRKRHGGAIDNQSANAFQQLRHDVARRAARNRRQSR